MRYSKLLAKLKGTEISWRGL